MSGIKPIETRYKGYRFRSRLEARWAVFFDALGLKWEYEYEGFALRSGWYLPDFYFPEGDYYIEIKPSTDAVNDRDISRYEELAKARHRGLYVLFGVPKLPLVEAGRGQVAKVEDGCFALSLTVAEGRDATPIWDFRRSVWQERDSDGEIFLWPCWAMEPAKDDEGVTVFVGDESLPGTWVFNPGSTKHHDTPRLIAAYEAARSARFEHGECG